jgi:hypothetical protein
MATRSDISVFWNTSPRLIVIAAPSTEVTIQDLHDTLRDIEDEPGALQYPSLISSAGKEPLGGGVTVGLTSTLNNAQVLFERRATAVTSGTFTSDSTPGRLVIATDTAATFQTDGVLSGYYLVNTADNSHAEVVEVIDENNLLVLSPTGGTENDYDTGETYFIYENVECSISGGNLVAEDEAGNSISPAFPTFGTFLIRTSSSSATLQELADIQYASFNGGITVDVTSPYSGTNYPNGTPRQPINNIADAVTMATNRGFTTLFILGDITLDDAVPSLNGFTFVGESANKSTIQIDANADVENSEFMTATINGILDGGNVVSDCVIETLNFVDGFITQCVLNGTITLSTQDDAHFLDCWSGVPGLSTPTIDFSGAGSGLAMRNYNGGITLRNKTGSEPVSVDLNSGQVVVEDTVTAGTIVLRGIGTWTNAIEYVGGADIVNQLINPLDMQAMSFYRGVTIDATSTYTGTTYPVGTPRMPVNNLADAKTLAVQQGFSILYIVGNYTFGPTDDISNYTIIGQNASKSMVVVLATTNTTNTEFQECLLTGSLAGGDNNIVRNSILYNLLGFDGIAYQCMLLQGLGLQEAAGARAALLSCYSGNPGEPYPYIEFGSQASLIAREYSGGLELKDKTGTQTASIDMQGIVIVNDSVDAGTVILRGVGEWQNEATYAGSATIENDLVSPTSELSIDSQDIRDSMLLDPSPTIVPGTESIDNKLDTIPASVVTALDGQTYDGVAFSDVLQDLLSMAKGRIIENPAGTFTFYEQDNSTPRFVLVKSGNQRSRV